MMDGWMDRKTDRWVQ